MFKPLTQLNQFFRLATERKLSGSDQLLWLHLFNLFNRQHWTETLRIKDAELKDLLRLYDTNGKPSSIDAIRRARQRLKAKGFIYYTAGDGYEPEYRMPCLYPADTPADTPANSYIRACEDVKTLDLKTSSSNNDDNAGARARVNRNSEDGVTATPSPQVDITPTPLDEVEDYWSRTLKGGRLSMEHLSEIQMLIERHGVDWVKESMRDASDANGNGLNMRLFRGVIRRKLNPLPKPKPALKGGERRDRGNESARRNVVALPDTYDPERDPVDWRQYLTGTGTSTARP